MKQNKKSRNSTLFMIELIIAILFFAIASSVCVQIFAKSLSITKESNELSFASKECSNIAEIICNSSSSSVSNEFIAQRYKQSDLKNSHTYIYFDDSFCNCSSKQARYIISVKTNQIHDLLIANIKVIDINYDNKMNRNKEIFSLNVKHNIRNGGI